MNAQIRLGLITAVVAACVVGALVAAKTAGWSPFPSKLPTSLSAPNHLKQVNPVHRWRIQPGEWVHTASVRFGVRGSLGRQNSRLQVEVAKDGASPSGVPAATASPNHPRHVVVRNLDDGHYRWWARVYNGQAVSRWVDFSRNEAFNVDRSIPSAPVIRSSTDPNPASVYHTSTAQFSWNSTDAGAGVKGYWYSLAPANTPQPTTFHVMTTTGIAEVNEVATGRYVFRAAARDGAGNWSHVSSFALNVDTTPPEIVAHGFSTFTFNPYYNTMNLNLRVNVPSTIRVGIYHHGTGNLVRLATLHSKHANQIVHFSWNGRSNKGRPVAEGEYDFWVRTTDQFGNSAAPAEYSGLTVTYKRIVVSLSQQKLWAYDHHNLYVSSLVTTGNPALPTPTGHFTILGKWHPFTFISKWPEGSQYYYAPSPVEYAMLFRQGGYYIHDAPWRSNFGPGSNSETGTPGQDYTGTHGCVNVPNNIAQELYSWASDGTPVVVKN